LNGPLENYFFSPFVLTAKICGHYTFDWSDLQLL